jgi:hypothetical protein
VYIYLFKEVIVSFFYIMHMLIFIKLCKAMVDLNLSVCPCCVPTVFIGVLAFTWLFLKITGFITTSAKKSKSIFGTCIAIAMYITNLLVVISAIGIGVLSASPAIRDRFFASMITKMTAGAHMDPMR